MNKAFVLGAGLGTRLGKITEYIPKPLIPVFGKPLIEFAFEHLSRHGFGEFVVNTHHQWQAYHDHFQQGLYGKNPITFRHEKTLLDTGGGIDNVSDLLQNDPFVVYNGDILTDLPLKELLTVHAMNKNVATLALRSKGANLHVGFDAASGMVTDIRDLLQTGNQGTHQFTGIYICSPEFLGYLKQGKKHSVIPVFLELIKSDALGAIVIDEGKWWDLGTPESYLDAHLEISRAEFPSYLEGQTADWKKNISHDAKISSGAKIDNASHIGSGASIGTEANIINSIVWPGAEIRPGVKITRCVVRSGARVHDSLQDVVV